MGLFLWTLSRFMTSFSTKYHFPSIRAKVSFVFHNCLYPCWFLCWFPFIFFFVCRDFKTIVIQHILLLFNTLFSSAIVSGYWSLPSNFCCTKFCKIEPYLTWSEFSKFKNKTDSCSPSCRIFQKFPCPYPLYSGIHLAYFAKTKEPPKCESSTSLESLWNRWYAFSIK